MCGTSCRVKEMKEYEMSDSKNRSMRCRTAQDTECKDMWIARKKVRRVVGRINEVQSAKKQEQKKSQVERKAARYCIDQDRRTRGRLTSQK